MTALKLALLLVAICFAALPVFAGILTKRHEAGRYVASRKQLRQWRRDRLELPTGNARRAS